MAIFVVRAPEGKVGQELVNGRARIGWSYQDNLDLQNIQFARTNGQRLNKEQRDAVRCLKFLNDIRVDDFLIYPNQKEYQHFMVVQVTGEYDYDQDGIDGDFRSMRPCKLVADSTNWYDAVVSSQFRHRLWVPGRISQVYDENPFNEFFEAYQRNVTWDDSG